VCNSNPTLPNGVFACGSDNPVSTECKGTCNAGYTGSPKVSCQQNSTWTEVDGSCEPGVLSQHPQPYAQDRSIAQCHPACIECLGDRAQKWQTPEALQTHVRMCILTDHAHQVLHSRLPIMPKWCHRHLPGSWLIQLPDMMFVKASAQQKDSIILRVRSVRQRVTIPPLCGTNETDVSGICPVLLLQHAPPNPPILPAAATPPAQPPWWGAPAQQHATRVSLACQPRPLPVWRQRQEEVLGTPAPAPAHRVSGCSYLKRAIQPAYSDHTICKANDRKLMLNANFHNSGGPDCCRSFLS
jgi:hypothetical protein